MSSTAQTITVAGGNLFAIAAQYLGDATQWNRIAALNGLTDFMIYTVTTLKIPPVKSGGNGGVLGQ
ncbi:MAG: LysM peptidoglycan-binding domain-containing protein [Devosia sp.]|nr:LysM peptidoglycan-binding domain-containing protein [Devosia sp.]